MPSIGTGEERRAHMLQDPMYKLIPSVALPSIISMMIGALYNMADTFFVGQLGTSATGAVGIVMPIVNLLQALAFIFAHGAANYISRLLGSGESERASRAVSTALVTDLFLGLLYGVTGILFLSPLLRLFGSTETILPYARQYAVYIYIAAPAFAGSYALNNSLRAEGSTMQSMIGMSSGAILNIILDPIFIFTLDMGVAGAGLATMIGQVFSFLLLLSYYLMKGNRHSVLRLSFKLFTPSRKLYAELTRIGFPSFIRMGLASVAAILLNTAAAPYGDAAIAAFSVVARLLLLVNHALVGYTQGYQPISGYNYGAKQYGRVSAAFRFTLASSAMFMILCGATLYTFAPGLISLFRDDPAVIAIGARALRFQAAALPLMALTTVSSMLFQSTGSALPAFFSTLSRQGLCFIPLVLLLPRLMGLTGLVIAQALADVLSLLIILPLLYPALRSLRNQTQEIRSQLSDS